jgi:hypothetical protein
LVTTAFEWRGFLTLAEELGARSEEYCLRTAISRAYYYAYHLARLRVIDNEFIIVGGGDSHKQIWEKYRDSPEYECKKLYLLAEHLKDKRQRADYDKEFRRVQDECPAVLTMTRKFAQDLAQLNPRLPVNRGVRR